MKQIIEWWGWDQSDSSKYKYHFSFLVLRNKDGVTWILIKFMLRIYGSELNGDWSAGSQHAGE